MVAVRISTIWASHSNSWEEAWLVAAWDEYSRENNEDGWAEALSKARLEHGDVKVIDITASDSALQAAFYAPVVEGKVLA